MHVVHCQAKAAERAAYKSEKVKRQRFKDYDEAVITARSGAGGNGECVAKGSGKQVDNFKYRPGGNQPKKIFLPSAEPADGADGADVLLFVDPALDSLLHLHERTVYQAKNGANGNPALGSSGPRSRGKQRVRTPALRVPVPPGTVVRRKRGGALLGELIHPGDALLVARGGTGGIGVVAPSREQNQRRRADRDAALAVGGFERVVVEDENWRVDARGAPGEEVGLQLQLRVVADVGLVGFPNAGKSSLLTALTRARPDIASYPFTTLTPNLGVYSREVTEEDEFGEFMGPKDVPTAVLADLPGLIEGAHIGRGLGRNFLRHLRRTRMLLHVVDGAAVDPATDYLAVREELRMYNPEYVTKPHVVALNKIDLEDAHELQEELLQAIQAAAQKLQGEYEGLPSLPAAIVPCSALEGEGLPLLREVLESQLQLLMADPQFDYDRRQATARRDADEA